MRKLIDVDPFVAGPPPFQEVAWEKPGAWPCSWIALPEARPPVVAAYRCLFEIDRPGAVRLHVSADERYRLLLDGRPVGRGPERPDDARWFFETYDLELDAGQHRLVAMVWSLGERAPMAQTSVRHGLVVAPQDPAHQAIMGTGRAVWEAKAVGGRTFSPGPRPDFVGGAETIDAAALAWDAEAGEGDGWGSVIIVEPAIPIDRGESPRRRHALAPARLAPQIARPVTGARIRHVDAGPIAPDNDRAAALEAPPIVGADHLAVEAMAWQALLDAGTPVTVPPRTTRRVLVDLDEYYCAYPALTVSGGAGGRVQLGWAESLFTGEDLREKGHRDEIEGRRWFGLSDTFLPDGARRRFEPLWWRAGRYLLLSVEAADAPVVVEGLHLAETRYPLEQESTLDVPLPGFERYAPIALRGLQMCAHETYMDCPFYEQLCYVGDTRLEILATYVLARDARLAAKAIRGFDASRLPSGWTQSRTPSRHAQMIPPFSLWWIATVRDYAWWRDDPDTVRGALGGVRAVVDAVERCLDERGIVRHPPGWNFVDWVPREGWRHGVPPDGGHGCSASVQWQAALALDAAADLERHFGDADLARRAERLADRAAEGAEVFFDAGRGRYADDLDRRVASQHAQCLALVSGRLDADRAAGVARALREDEDLAPASIYFTHYVLEACRMTGDFALLVERLGEWQQLADLGFRTTRESPEPSRSDCHGWGAHPLFHAAATVAGIRPDAPGFRRVRVAPLLGDLPRVDVRIPHPAGEVRVALERSGEAISGRIDLPPGVTGTFAFSGREHPLERGTNRL